MGWRTGYRIIAVLILCAATPVTLLLIRVTPEEMGLTPYGQRLQEHGAPEKHRGDNAVNKGVLPVAKEPVDDIGAHQNLNGDGHAK